VTLAKFGDLGVYVKRYGSWDYNARLVRWYYGRRSDSSI